MKFDINSKNENLFNQFGQTEMTGSFNTHFSLGKKGTGTGFLANGTSFKRELINLSKGQNLISKTKTKEIKFKDSDFAQIEKLESVKIEKEDAVFFLNLLENSGITTNVKADGEVVQNQKVANVSRTMMNLLAKANDSKKPVRLDFDNNITLVLRLDKDGKLNAQFFPSDKVAEEYLKNNIPFLKQQFDEKGIKYSNLSHHGQREKQQKEKQDE